MPVLDWVVASTEGLDQYRELLRGLSLYFIVLAPTLEVSLQRDSRRADKHLGERFGYLDEQMRKYLSDVGLWVDSGDLTPEETVDRIVAGRDRALV